MSERLNIVTPRQYTDSSGNVKTAWTRIGTAWSNAKGWSLTFDALPIPSMNDKGQLEVRALLMPPTEQAPANAPQRQGKGPAYDSDNNGDDTIPF